MPTCIKVNLQYRKVQVISYQLYTEIVYQKNKETLFKESPCFYIYLFLPIIKLMTKTITAMTSKKWMTAPPILATTPIIQNKTNKPINVHKILPIGLTS